MNATQAQPGRAVRALGWAMAAVLGLPALVLLAWLATNWGDAPALPRPAVLQLPAAALSEARNAHDALAGVLALPGADPAQVARDERARTAVWLAKPLAERMAMAAKPPKTPQAPTRQPLPRGAPWACPDGQPLCAGTWLDQPAALERQRDALAWGARCDALADDNLVIEEHIEQPLHMAGVVAQHLTGGNACTRWLQTGIALAFAAGDDAALTRDLARADRLNRALLGGSRSVVSTLVTARTAHTLLDLVATLAVRDAALAERLSPLLAGWPAQAGLARRWMVHESNFGVAALDEAFAYCAEPGIELPPAIAANLGWSERLTQRVNQLMCRHGIGLHHQRTQAYADAQWLGRLAVLDAGGLEALDRFSQTPEGGGLGGLHWRNTFGAMLVDIGSATYGDHVRRQRDLELHHRLVSLVLSMQRQGIEPGSRAGWLARQPLAADERDRIVLRDQGRTIAARGFAERSPVVGSGGEFRITWPD